MLSEFVISAMCPPAFALIPAPPCPPPPATTVGLNVFEEAELASGLLLPPPPNSIASSRRLEQRKASAARARTTWNYAEFFSQALDDGSEVRW